MPRFAGTLGGYALTAVLPRCFDAPLCALLATVLRVARRGERRRIVAAMARDLGPAGADLDLERVAREHYRMRVEKNWVRMRSMHRRLRRVPAVRIEGLEHLRTALDRGHGAILWRMHFGSTVWVQAACQQAGLPPVQLSQAGHGATSYSRLGYGVNRRLYVRAETGYLAERVVIPADGSLGYMRTLIDRLERRNAVVAIRGELRSRQSVVATLFGAPVELANGAPSLAWRTGAALLTAYALRDGPFDFRLVIDPPIELDRACPRKEAAAVAAREFASRLEAHVKAHPADWMGWYRRLG